MEDIRVYFKGTGDVFNRRSLGKFSLSILLAPHLVLQLMDGSIEPAGDSGGLKVMYPRSINGTAWMPMGESGRLRFDAWILGLLQEAKADPRWRSGSWFRVA